mmetsp:Transcript_28207/g.46397  ORF Transcript_28207/g.46397 Transcript_28207/m.46397 type:complete len:275 (-) Transcript_28207:129-953(-)
MQQLKGGKGSTAMSQWAHNEKILRDQAVDTAMEKAQTNLLYKKYLEQQQKKWEVPDIKLGPRPTIKDSDPFESKSEEQDVVGPIQQKLEDFNQDYDSLDELEKEVLGDDDDKELAKLQERRKQQLKREWKQKQQEMAQGAGRYEEMDERDMLKLASKGGNIIAHFYASGIDLGKIVDEHMKKLAPRHTEARFVMLDARKSPFLVNKWKIRTLPTISVIVKGYLVDKVIGFDDFGGKEDFPTLAMERRLAKSGVIKDPEGKIKGKVKRTKILTEL